METLKIAFVYDAVYPWIKGGAEKRIYEISKRLVSKGHEVHWYGVGWWFNGNKRKVIEKDGIILHGVCKPVQLYVNGRRSISEAIYFAAKLFPELVKDKFDIVDCQEFPYFSCFSAKSYSIFKKSKLVITWLEVWGDYWFEYLGKKGIFGYLIEKSVSKLPNGLITISKIVMNDLINILDIKPNTIKISIIPDGIDFNKIQDVKINYKQYDVIYVGRLIDHKNVNILIKSIKILKSEFPNIKCCIVGDGPERRNLEILSKKLELNKNIKFAGFLENDIDVYFHMKSSKVFVLPSTREGAGLVTLEANACGLPAITVWHKKNATIEVIENNKNGFVCTLSEKALAETIKLALNKYKNMERTCIKFAKKYDWSVISRLTENFYKKIN